MDFGDLQNHRTGKKAEEAAQAAQENSRQIQRLQNSINQQQNVQQRQQDLATNLYNLSIALNEDLKILEYEPTEENSLAIANKYLRASLEDVLDPNNHPNLEYKKLATDTQETYCRLDENDWFKWAKSRVLTQIEQEREIQAQADAQKRTVDEANRKKAEAEQNKFNAGCLVFFVLSLIGGCVAYETGKSDKPCPNCSAIGSLGYFGNNSECSNCREKVQ